MEILLRCSWQTVNIGDIAHSPGIIRALKKGLPDCRVTLWASGEITQEVKDLIHSDFPEVSIIPGDAEHQKELEEAMDRSVDAPPLTVPLPEPDGTPDAEPELPPPELPALLPPPFPPPDVVPDSVTCGTFAGFFTALADSRQAIVCRPTVPS